MKKLLAITLLCLIMAGCVPHYRYIPQFQPLPQPVQIKPYVSPIQQQRQIIQQQRRCTSTVIGNQIYTNCW